MESTMSIKRWKKVQTFNTFEEADALRNKIIAEDDTNTVLVKVRCAGIGGEKYAVKMHAPAAQKTNKQKKKGDKNDNSS